MKFGLATAIAACGLTLASPVLAQGVKIAIEAETLPRGCKIRFNRKKDE